MRDTHLCGVETNIVVHKAGAESRFEGELSDGCEHYDPATMRAAALREALRRRGVAVSEEASRDELIRAAEDAGIGSESKHSA